MIGRRLCDRYEVLAELGRGGMGVVYRARDPRLDREVAIKMVDGRGTRSIDEQRFQREARMAAQLDHPAIVPIFDFGRHEDTLFFVMPVLPGDTLDHRIAERNLVLGEVLEIGAQVAEALDYSSAEGVVHRDVKPENVMVHRSPEGLTRVWVLDFGLALTRESHRITRPDRLPGTLAYLSPEHILSLDLDGRSDLYSLGVILYECLAGVPPFAGGSQGSVLYRIVHESAPSLAAAGVDRGLEEVVSACLAKDPSERPIRGRELAQQLRRILSNLAAGERQRPTVTLDRRGRAARPLEIPLVGRDRELAQLRRCFEASQRGGAQLVLLAGGAGQGKSRLLREVARFATESPRRVLRGRFAGHEAAFPHHGFCELIQDAFRDDPLADDAPDRTSASEDPSAAVASTDERVLEDLAGPLLALFPVLSEVPELRRAAGSVLPALGEEDPRTVPGRGDPTQVYELLARTFLTLARGKAMVLLLENLHAAGASVDALEYLVRRLGSTPTLIVATYRSDDVELRHPIHRLRRNFEGDTCFTWLRIDPLGRNAHRQLVAALLRQAGQETDRTLADRLFEASDGNPFFTRELVRSLAEAGELGPGREEVLALSHPSGTLEALPETIQQVVETRLERLPEDLLAVLALASVLGRRFDFRDLQRLAEGDRDGVVASGAEDGALEDRVDQLVREGFLEEDRAARGDVLLFTSGMVRDVLHRGLPRRRRRALHRRYANALERRHQHRLEKVYPQLVHHFSEGDEAVKTVSYALMLARRSVGVFSPHDTVRSARTALEFIVDDELEDTGEVEGELRLLLAGALRLLANIDGALREGRRAVARFEAAGEVGAAAEAAWVVAETAWRARRLDDTRQWLRHGIDLARRGGGGERLVRFLNLAATLANLRGDGRRAASLLREAEELVRRAAAVGGTESGATLRTVLPNPLTTFDPAAAFSLEDAEVLANVFETLVGSDLDGNLVPRLGIEWASEAGGTRVRVRLRSGVLFSDGTPCDARAVREALWESARRPVSDPAAAWGVLEGLEAWRAGTSDGLAGIALGADGESLEFRLVRPLPIFASLLTDLRTAVARPLADGGLSGTGPFALAEGPPSAPVLIRNPRWRGNPAPCERIELTSRLGSQEVAEGLRRGELDLVRDLPPVVLEDLLRDPELRSGLVEAPKRNTYFALFNHRGPSTCSSVVRQVLAATVRPQNVVWRTLGRLAQPASCLLPPGILGHDPGRRWPVLSLDEARQLLDSVLPATDAQESAKGRGSSGLGTPRPLRVVVHPAFRERFASLERALFETWTGLGFEIEVVGASIDDQIRARRDGAGVDVLLTRWAPDYEDPDNVLRGMFHSRSGVYRGYFSDGELDEMLDSAGSTEGAAARRRLYRRIEGRLMGEHAVLPLFHEVDYRLASPRVQGVRHLGSPPYVAYSEIARVAATRRSAGGSVMAPPLRLPLGCRLETLEPELSLLAESGEVLPTLFETLTRVDSGARIVPHLAEEVRLEDGATRLAIRLRRGVRFHDGRLLGARDVRYSFERLLRSPYAGVASPLSSIRGAEAFRSGESQELVGLRFEGSHQLTLELAAPNPLLPAMLSSPAAAIVPEGSAHFDGHWRQGTVGSGPYRVVHFEPQRRLELEAHPDYWGPAPRSRRLVFELGVSSEAMLSGLRDGRWSLATALRPGDVETLRQEPRFAAGFTEGPTFSTFVLVLNARRGPFADPERRHALRAHLDVAGLLRSTFGRLALPASGVLSAGVAGHEGESGPTRLPTPPPSLLAGLEVRASVHPIFLGQYAFFWRRLLGALHRLEIGIDAPRRSLRDSLIALEAAEVDLVVARRLAAYPDPDAFVHVFHSRRGLYGGLVGSIELDRQIEDGLRERDPVLRHGLYRELERTLARESLIVPLFDEQLYCLTQPEIEGVRLRLGWPRLVFDELEWRV